MPVVGFLRSSTFADVPHWVTAFRRGLNETGFVEGQNVAMEYRSADNQPDRLPALVTDLISALPIFEAYRRTIIRIQDGTTG